MVQTNSRRRSPSASSRSSCINPPAPHLHPTPRLPGLTAAFREFTDTGVILSVVILNAIIGYIQEYKAEESVTALQKLAVSKARVLRKGRGIG